MTGFDDLCNDPRSTDEIIEAQIVADARGEDAGHIVVLHARGGREEFDAAHALARSPDPARRKIGARIFGELGLPVRTFSEECCDELLRLLQDADKGVRIQAVFALGHLRNRRPDAAILPLRDDPNAEMRHAVAFALCGSVEPQAIDALLRLMEDSNLLARDWATTGIGGMSEIDGDNIRAALLKRCADDDVFTRGEALCGLARRKDARVIPSLLREYDAEVGVFEDHAREAVALYLDADEASGNHAMWFEKLKSISRDIN